MARLGLPYSSVIFVIALEYKSSVVSNPNEYFSLLESLSLL